MKLIAVIGYYENFVQYVRSLKGYKQGNNWTIGNNKYVCVDSLKSSLWYADEMIVLPGYDCHKDKIWSDIIRNIEARLSNK